MTHDAVAVFYKNERAKIQRMPMKYPFFMQKTALKTD